MQVTDEIDGEECIVSIMRGLGGNVNRLLPGVGFHVDDRKGGDKGGVCLLRHCCLVEIHVICESRRGNRMWGRDCKK